MNVGKTTIRNNEIRNNAPVPFKYVDGNVRELIVSMVISHEYGLFCFLYFVHMFNAPTKIFDYKFVK